MRIMVLMAASLAVLATPVLAHPGGHDDEQQVQTPHKAARSAMLRLVTQSKLPTSWSSAQLVSTRERTVKGVHQTVVTFRNDAEPNAARKLLHVALNQEGGFISAGHTL
jgi:hypothetical protein